MSKKKKTKLEIIVQLYKIRLEKSRKQVRICVKEMDKKLKECKDARKKK